MLDDRTAAKALERARGGGKLEEVRAAARRAGAPVAAGPALSAAGALVAGMSEGARLPSNWAAVLRREIGEAGGEATASELAASAWMLATPERHGEALRDLLLLSDRIPRRRRGELRFPPLARA